MVFIRRKRIKGRDYFYLAKTVRRDGKVMQITLEYIGKEIPTTEQISKLKQKYK